MKKMTCAEIGGPADCGHEIASETAEEMISTGWDHVQAAHPELAAKIASNPKEENDRWMAGFKETFAAHPEA